MRRVMIVAIPVDDDSVDVHQISDWVADAMALNDVRDVEDDSQCPTAYEDVASLLDDLGVKVPKRMNAGRRAMVTVEHNAREAGTDNVVRLNANDEVTVIEWMKPFGSYLVQSPVGPKVWVDPDDLVFDHVR